MTSPYLTRAPRNYASVLAQSIKTKSDQLGKENAMALAANCLDLVQYALAEAHGWADPNIGVDDLVDTAAERLDSFIQDEFRDAFKAYAKQLEDEARRVYAGEIAE